jgi:Ras-related protein Rab-5C
MFGEPGQKIPTKRIKTKIVLLGDTSVGKTSLAHRFQKDEMPQNVSSTLGAQFITVTLPDEHAELQFDIWDTAGQERFKSLGSLYYRNAKAALVVYDISSEKSLQRAKEWIAELQQSAEPDIIITLIGNKCDLEDQRVIPVEVVLADL